MIAFLDSLKGRPELSFGSIGRTTEGREIPYVVASRPRVSTPAQAASLRRPVVYIQGNIHAGEVEGKEALLALLRDLTSSARPNVLDSVVLIAVPIYNADGNERFASQRINRGSQNGPELVGVRANAQGLDLNRDYVKAEAPETRAALAMFSAWKPHMFVDLHTTDGSYHGYALTYSGTLNPAAPFGVFTRDSLIPILQRRMRARHGYATFDYGDFVSEDTLTKGWTTFDARARYGTNYYGLRGNIALLSEAYSHDPFEKRVKSTYAFVREILALAAERSVRITAGSRAETAVLTFAGSGLRDLPIQSRLVAAPDSADVVAEVIQRTGDSTRSEPGMPPGRRRSGQFISVRMPVYDRFQPTLLAPVPERYVIPPSDTAVVKLLRLHGIEVRVSEGGVPGAALVGNGYVFMIDSVIVSPRVFQGHREMRLTGRWRRETREIRPGSFIVETAQPLGPLAVYLLEPQSDDGLVTWNFFDAQLRPGGVYPVFKVGGAPPSP